MLQKQARSSNHRLRTHLTVLIIYLLLAVALTYPLILRITTHVTGDGRDDPPLLWNLWWVRYALLNLHTNPLLCTYMFFPIGINLTYFTLTILNGVLSMPMQLTGGVVLTNNLLLLASYTLAAFGTYVLMLDLFAASHRTNRSIRIWLLAAFVAGLVYAFAPIKMIFASLGQFNMTSNQWMPFYILYLLRATRPLREQPRMGASPRRSGVMTAILPGSDRAGRRDAFLAALFLLFTAYAEFTFASFLVIFTAVYIGYLLLTRRTTTLTFWMLGRLLVLGLVFVIGLWPILGSMLREMATEGDYSLTTGWGFADIFVADLLGFFIPSHLHPVFGSFAQEATRGFSYTNFAWVGCAILLLSLVGLLARRRRQDTDAAPVRSFWGFSALLYAVLSLGPVLHIAGRWVFDLDGLSVRVPLLFIILHYIPFIKANRYPSRLHVLVVLCLAVLVAYGVAAILHRTRMSGQTAPIDIENEEDSPRPSSLSSSRLQQRSTILQGVVTFVMAGMILFEYLAIPLPLSDMRVPDVYRQIAQDNQHAPVLQLPISWRNSFQFIPQNFTLLPQDINTVVMFEQFYQTVHEGPILSGNTSRNPEFKFTYFLEAPIIRTIVALEEGRTISPEQITYDRSIMPEFLHFFGFKYIVLHPPLVGGPVEDYVRAVFPVQPIPADMGLSAYRVIAPPAVGRLTITMDGDMSNLYRAEGWGQPQVDRKLGDERAFRWSDRASARVLIPLAQPAPLTLTITLYLSYPHLRAAVMLNGHRLDSEPDTSLFAPAWTELRINVPREATRAGVNDLVIAVDKLGPLPYEPAAPFMVGQTGVATSANVVAYSAGLDAGGDMGFAHIYVNGQDVISGRRGLNVVVIEPTTGAVERIASFDLLGDGTANARFRDFIGSVPTGQIVAVAVMDDASVNFGDQSAQALRLIGAQGDLRDRFRASYAAIGVKGALPGQALEQWGNGRPASVAVGAHIYGRGLGVAVSRITVETNPPSP